MSQHRRDRSAAKAGIVVTEEYESRFLITAQTRDDKIAAMRLSRKTQPIRPHPCLDATSARSPD